MRAAGIVLRIVSPLVLAEVKWLGQGERIRTAPSDVGSGEFPFRQSDRAHHEHARYTPLVAVHPPWVVESDKEPERAGEEGDIADIDRPDDCARGKAANKRTL